MLCGSAAFRLTALAIAMSTAACQSNTTDQLDQRSPKLADAQVYELETKCAEEAKVFFGESWREGAMTAGLTYSNHYSRSRNKCLILVREQSFMDANNAWSRSITLADVHERANVGVFLESHSATSATLATCNVAGTPCTSEDDFDSKVKPYMTN